MASQEPRKILVRAPNWLGDHVMALPCYEALRGHYTQAHITLLAVSVVAEFPAKNWFDNVIVLERKNRFWKFARRLSLQNFDLAISLPASLSSAMLFYLSQIPQRVGYAQDGSDFFLTASVPWRGREAGKHKSELYIELAEFVTGKVFPRPSVSFEPPQIREKLIVVAPGASLPLREWPGYLEYLPLLRQVLPNYRLVVVGTDEKWRSQIKRLGDGGIEEWIGKTSLSELLNLFRRAALVVCNDSGPAHLAAREGARVLALFGPGDPAYVKPKEKKVAIARLENLPCSPCESTHCRGRFGYQACLRELPTTKVLESTLELLRSDVETLDTKTLSIP